MLYRASVAFFVVLLSILTPCFATRCWAQQRPAPIAPVVTLRSALVHIAGSRPVQLERRGATRHPYLLEEDTWMPVCPSPCDAQVPLDGTYRISGHGMRATGPFALEGKEGSRIVIEVNPGSKGAVAGGIVLVSLSPIALLVGAMIYVLASGADIDHHLAPTGIAIAGVGAVGLAAGIVLIVTNVGTGQTQTSDPGSAARQPDWRDPGFAAAKPPQLMLPALTF